MTFPSFSVLVVESQDSKDGLSVSTGEERKPPPMPEETGKSKVASWLTSQSSTSANQSVKVEGGIKTEKKVSLIFTHPVSFLSFHMKCLFVPLSFCVAL